MKYLTGKEGRRDCTLLYYFVQSSDYLRCVDILNHKITPLIRLLIIQKYPMKKQTLSQEFRQNNIKSLRKLINYHSPIVFIFISIIYSLFWGLVITTALILFIFQNIYKLLSIIETVCYTANGYFRIPLYNFSLALYTPTM